MSRLAKLTASKGLQMAREKLIEMTPEQRSHVTCERLISSFGIHPFEAENLVRAFGGNHAR